MIVWRDVVVVMDVRPELCCLDEGMVRVESIAHFSGDHEGAWT